ncbi:MAG: hypothetical protein ABFD97_19930 [Syntrophobacter sp.]
MFDDLSDDELQQIYNLAPQSEKVYGILAKEDDDSSKLFLREHAFFAYWKRRMDSGSVLSDEEVNSILKRSEFPASKGILGDSAIYNLLSKYQCSYLLTQLYESEWAYKAVQSRVLVMDIINQSGDNKDQQYNRISKILDQLIYLNMTWAILEVLAYLNLDLLYKLHEDMENKRILTKQNRHLIRERIEKIYKEMQGKAGVKGRG